jgi:DNA-binding response OmpR family regulator
VRILVAEDDRALRDVLKRGLQEAGYVVDTAADGAVARALLRHNDYAAAIVDWRMPEVTGIDLVTSLRRDGIETPIIMLTARDSAMNRVEGLESGADDYLVKPFDFSELLARIRALLRRPPMRHGATLRCGDIEFDPASRETTVGGAKVALTTTEALLMELLLRRSPRTVTRVEIARHVWETQSGATESNTIEVHIARLRSKLTAGSARIATVRGIGYQLVAS